MRITILRIAMLAPSLLLWTSCPSIVTGDKEITSFAFLKADNPQLAADYAGVVTGTDIDVFLPLQTDRSSLVATFTTSGAAVTVGNVDQASGVTDQSFWSTVEYVVHASDGTTATYTVDTLRLTKVFATDPEDGHSFGWSADADGDFVIVGAHGSDIIATESEAAYVYRRTGAGAWDSVTKLVSSDGELGDEFGISVAINGEYAIVGARSEGERGASAGAAYVFHRTGTETWDAGVKLLGTDTDESDGFGQSVSICGDYAVVGACWAGEGGAAYVFRLTDTGEWTDQSKLVAPDAESGDSFGWSVSIDGEYLIVGAMVKDDGANVDAGAAYVFRRTDTNSWDSVLKLKAVTTHEGDRFGKTVSLHGDYVVVGAPWEDASGSESGAVYVFRRTADNDWASVVKLVAAEAWTSDKFGWSVSMDGDLLLVGAYQEDFQGVDAGAAYFFHRSGTNSWVERKRLVAADGEAEDYFGYSVAIGGGHAVFTALFEDDAGLDAGAAYIY